MLKTEELKLVSEWDKTFPQSEKVDHKKVTFVNRYGITLAADLYKRKNVSGKIDAANTAVSHVDVMKKAYELGKEL